MKEIERKFIIESEEKKEMIKRVEGVRIMQWYLNRDKQRVVRVRIKGKHAYLTIKGSNQGITRNEFEYEIPYSDALDMLGMAEGRIIEKIRRNIEYKGHVWEVDEFMGELAGLMLAEIELNSEDESFAKPPFVDREVSDDPAYYNSNLAAGS